MAKNVSRKQVSTWIGLGVLGVIVLVTVWAVSYYAPSASMRYPTYSPSAPTGGGTVSAIPSPTLTSYNIIIQARNASGQSTPINTGLCSVVNGAGSSTVKITGSSMLCTLRNVPSQGVKVGVSISANDQSTSPAKVKMGSQQFDVSQNGTRSFTVTVN